jgi:hypothetical protein
MQDTDLCQLLIENIVLRCDKCLRSETKYMDKQRDNSVVKPEVSSLKLKVNNQKYES